MASFVKVPCKHCPYRRDVKPYLTPERGEELAYLTQNPYNDFSCHKTTEYNEELEEQTVTERTLTCAGFLTLQMCESDRTIPGFTPSYDLCYESPHEMADAYENANQ